MAVSACGYSLALLRIIVGGFQIALIGWFHFMAARTKGIGRRGLNADVAARRDRNKRDDGNDENFCSFLKKVSNLAYHFLVDITSSRSRAHS